MSMWGATENILGSTGVEGQKTEPYISCATGCFCTTSTFIIICMHKPSASRNCSQALSRKKPSAFSKIYVVLSQNWYYVGGIFRACIPSVLKLSRIKIVHLWPACVKHDGKLTNF